MTDRDRLNQASRDGELSEEKLQGVTGGLVKPKVKTHCPTRGSSLSYVDGRPWCNRCQKNVE